MYRLLYILFALCFCFNSYAIKNLKNLGNDKTKNSHCFIENKGQVCNQNFEPRADVLFSGTDGQLNFHLKNNGISYQLNKIDSWHVPDSAFSKTNVLPQKIAKQITTYRIDVNWLNANVANIKKGYANDNYDSYYLQHCPNGILNVKNYNDVTYQNIYDGIDLKWYQKDGHLKYDYIIAAGANYKHIKLQVNGAKKITINKKGELVINTPLGDIIEQTPEVIQDNKVLKAKWIINGNIVSYEIENVNPNQSFVIDPIIRTWGTYYGGNAYTYINSTDADTLGNVLITGHTSSNMGTTIATTGSYQTSMGALVDAFLVKFDALGVRQWGTYYGGNDTDEGVFCITDKQNNVYVLGATESNTGAGIASIGSHQYTYGGSTDAFLVKFNSSGFRIWGTYYGGNDIEGGTSCSIDTSGYVYISGYTKSNIGTVIASSGSHQSNCNGDYDSFLVKFDSSGVRQWGTYYGGSLLDFGWSCSTDKNNNIYLSGYTESNTGTNIATPGSHQPLFGNPSGLHYDAFLVKFNSAGVRQWGTYYGGNESDVSLSCTTDLNGDIYLSGTSSSTTNISTPSSHQINYAGAPNPNYGDAFLVKFNANGVRLWGTYYGGSDGDGATFCMTDVNNNIYIVGGTASISGSVIATPASPQPVYGGSAQDGFLAMFNSNGVRQWGTYYGGNAPDDSRGCSTYKNIIYLVGYTESSGGTAIATSTSHQPNYSGGSNGYLVQFNDCNTSIPPINTTPLSNEIFCANNSSTLTVAGFGVIDWYNVSTGGLPVGNGSTFITPTLSAGTYTFYAEDSICNVVPSRTAITVTVMPVPVASITVGNDSICNGQSATLAVSGGTNVIWSNSSTTNTINVTPSITSSYSVVVSNTSCSDTAFTTIIVLANPSALISGIDSICNGQTSILTASGGSSYLWSTSTTANSVTISPVSTTSYSVIVSNGSCADTAFMSLNVFPVPVATISGNYSICFGETTTLVAGGGGNYLWNTGSVLNSISQSPTINAIYSVIASNGLCSDTAQVSVVVNPLPIASISGINSICNGQSTNLVSSGGSFYSWNTGSTSSSITVSPSINTSYSVIVSNTFGCKDTSYTQITVLPLPSVSISGDSIICASDPLTLTANGIGIFLWNTGETTTSITSNPLNNTIFNVLASNTCGTVKDSISITVNPLPVVTVSSDTTILIDNSLVLYANGGGSYNWLPMGLSCNTCSAITVSPSTTTAYTVTVTNANGCSIMKTITVNVESNFDVFIPDIFSPNADGQNDILYVRGIGIREMTFRVYDRLGEKIFETNDSSKGWDGTYKGMSLNNAVFVYELVATLINGVKINKHGDVTLIR